MSQKTTSQGSCAASSPPSPLNASVTECPGSSSSDPYDRARSSLSSITRMRRDATARTAAVEGTSPPSSSSGEVSLRRGAEKLSEHADRHHREADRLEGGAG